MSKRDVRYVIELGKNGETTIKSPPGEKVKGTEKTEKFPEPNHKISGVLFINGEWVKIG